MIVGTAGHIDHGKTSLVKALTGVDADRLKEEKARGITIDLGYAYQALPDGEVLGFVDVPGHERFIHNMLAGATGIDYVLLVVAADDGPMPQTREHLAILALLGLEHGVVALSKADRVDEARRGAALGEVQRLLAEYGRDYPVLPLSALSGEGVAALQAHLHAAALSLPQRRRDGGHFRLAVDRSFTLAGIGTVVTGTVFAGQVAVGERLVVSPSGTEVRVRGLHAQNRAAETGALGQRCALNIAAPRLDKRDIMRGEWLLGEALHAPSQRLDVRLELLPGEAKALRHWTPVHVHLGACDVIGRVALLDDAALAPGANALAQLVLDQPIGALHGDRFIVRDASAQRTIGGGRVLDAFAPPRGRRKPQRIAVLRALEASGPREALQELLQLQASGVDLDWFARLYNLREAELEPLLAALPMQRLAVGEHRFGFDPAQWGRCAALLLRWLEGYHARTPDSAGASADELRAALPERPALAVLTGILETLLAEGRLVRVAARYQLPGHQVRLNDAEQVLWERALPLLQAGGLAPPTVAELAQQLRVDADRLREVLCRLVRMGRLHRVRREVFFLPRTVAELAARTEALAGQHPRGIVTVGPFREATGIGRNLGIPMLEFFDRCGFTMRRDDGRRVRRESAAVFGDAAP